MTSQPIPSHDDHPFRVGELCLQFEQSLAAGLDPSISAYLAEAAPSSQPKLLQELLYLDWRRRIATGKPIDPKPWLEQFPQQRRVISQVWGDLQRHGPRHFASPLARQIEAACADYQAALAGDDLPPMSAALQQVRAEGRAWLLAKLVRLTLDALTERQVAMPEAALLRANPELRRELESLVRDVQDQDATEFLPASQQQAATAPSSRRRKGSRGLHVRCPHCSNPVEILADTPFDSIDCTVCGSAFSLVDRSQETHLAETLKHIGRFELIARVGVGGFGTVWKARDSELDRVVAVKIPRRNQLNADEIEQFLREARAAAQLTHPHIVQVYEVGRDGDDVFIVSEFVRGVTLKDYFSGGRPPARETALLCRKIADGLAHAHALGIVHRDLKPQNVMLDDAGEPRVMDFGLAKRHTDEIAITRDGQVVGTPAYMAPEQAAGNSKWVDARSDVYGLGVMLFEMLTGELPFRGNAQLQMHQRQVDDAPSVRSLNRTIPLDLATICAKCLERAAGNRYAHAGELRDELARFLERRPIRARPISRPQRAVRWAQRHPARAAIAALVTLVAVVGPLTAVRFHRLNQQLSRRQIENERLYDQRAIELAAAERDRNALQQQLAQWTGDANPWLAWGGPEGTPPHGSERPVQELLAARRALLEQPGTATDAGQAAVDEALRWLTLAQLHEAVNHPQAALAALEQAVGPLERTYRAAEDPGEAGLALLDCYQRLAQLNARQADAASGADLWTERAHELCREMAARRPTDPLWQGLLLESQLVLAAAGGFTAGEAPSPAAFEAAFAPAQQLADRLRTLWPRNSAALYALASRLTRRTAFALGAAPDAAVEAVPLAGPSAVP